MISSPTEIGKHAGGFWTAASTTVVCAIVLLVLVVLFYRINGRRYEQRRRLLRERYQHVYRVLSIPENPDNIKLPPGAHIQIGDYGWEAEARNHGDGLIYLQGLSEKWQVVWYAAFRPDQVEKVAPKPRSQYDWDYSWCTRPPPCEFPIQTRQTSDWGLPDVWGWNGPKRK